MKRAILTVTAILAIAALSYILYVWGQAGKYSHKIWLHRCNSTVMLRELEHRYPSVEVDICLRQDGVMDVTHDEGGTRHQGITPYLEYLAQHSERHIWMDVKNLSQDNQPLFKYRLDSLIHAYGVDKSQLVIESPQWKLLFPFTRDHYYTSCRVTAPRPSSLSDGQRDSVISRLGTVTRSGCVRALSFPAYWYNTLRWQFRSEDIDYLARMSQRTRMGMQLDPLGLVMMRDRRVKVILVKDQGDNHR